VHNTENVFENHFARRVGTGLLALLCALVLTACARPPESLLIQGPIMGTSYTVRVLRRPAQPDGKTLSRSVEERLEALNARLSTYVDSSDVVRFSAAPADQWVPVSRDTLAVVAEALRISRASDGAFDITVAPLVDLWGFGPDGQPGRVPGEEEIERLLAASGYRRIELRDEPPALRKDHPELRIDLSAIAKGYAVDELARLLDEAGFTDYMVEIGGEVRTRGHRPDGTPWRIALESPLAGTREVLRVLPLSGESVASSGDYRNFFEHMGRRYGHTIDPRSGWPVEHGLGAASVIAASCMAADAWATALMVLGAEEGLRIAEREGLAANLVTRSQDGFVESMTSAYRTRAGALDPQAGEAR
jgi:thiamine biosynthesis lipoprotein